MGKCKDCKHWSDKSNWSDVDYRDCKRCKEFDSLCTPYTEALDSWGENKAPAWLETHPEFGCVMFEAKA